MKNRVKISWQDIEGVNKKVRVVEFANGELKPVIPHLGNRVKEVVLKVHFYPQINKNLLLALLTIDALQRLNIEKVVLEAWWFPYSPQNAVFLKGEPLSMELVVRLLETAGVDEFIVYDLHHLESLSFFNKPVVHLSFLPWFEEELKNKVNSQWLIVSPDEGGKERGGFLAKRLGLGLGWFKKERDRVNGKLSFRGYFGPNVLNKKVILIDDFSAGGGTLLNTAKKLKDLGASYVLVCLSHLLMSKEHFQQLNAQGVIDEWLIGNSWLDERKHYP